MAKVNDLILEKVLNVKLFRLSKRIASYQSCDNQQNNAHSLTQLVDSNQVMEDQLSLLSSVPGWQFVLAHYARTDATVIPQLESNPGKDQPKPKNWLNRYDNISDSSTDELEERYSQLTAQQISQAHGILIALGYLEFDLVNRSDGIGYSLTTSGKNLLANPHLLDDNHSEDQETSFIDHHSDAA